MTLPKRNRLNTCINGVQYHWVKGSRGDNSRGVVTVQHADGEGAKLMIDSFCQIRDNEVPDAIRFALDAGWRPTESGWADGNTSPTRKQGVGTIPRLRVGLVLKPLVQLLAAISSGQSQALLFGLDSWTPRIWK